MSYCRWSSDCYQSDVYVYESNEGFMIHVASRKYVSDIKRPSYPGPGIENLSKYLAIDCPKWLKSSHLEPIGLPLDGKSFCLETAAEAAAKLEELRAMGYIVPQYAIDCLRQESEGK
jgi:hypothetical protein